jgi:hypothetical protein
MENSSSWMLFASCMLDVLPFEPLQCTVGFFLSRSLVFDAEIKQRFFLPLCFSLMGMVCHFLFLSLVLL